MDLKEIENELNIMRCGNKIDNYFLKRNSIDKCELEVHHKINGKMYCVSMDFYYEVFSVPDEIKKLKWLMAENYKEYLK